MQSPLYPGDMVVFAESQRCTTPGSMGSPPLPHNIQTPFPVVRELVSNSSLPNHNRKKLENTKNIRKHRDSVSVLWVPLCIIM